MPHPDTYPIVDLDIHKSMPTTTGANVVVYNMRELSPVPPWMANPNNLTAITQRGMYDYVYVWLEVVGTSWLDLRIGLADTDPTDNPFGLQQLHDNTRQLIGMIANEVNSLIVFSGIPVNTHVNGHLPSVINPPATGAVEYYNDHGDNERDVRDRTDFANLNYLDQARWRTREASLIPIFLNAVATFKAHLTTYPDDLTPPTP